MLVVIEDLHNSIFLNFSLLCVLTACYKRLSSVLNIVTDIKETATAVNHTLIKLVSLQVEEGDDNQCVRPQSG